jgi:large conductance mechanosensitive channel
MLELNQRPVGMLKSFLHDFKEFAVKGNAIDLAVGVVIGAAFGSVVKSLVDDVIMPPLGLLTGGVDFSNKKLVLKDALLGPDGKVLKDAVDLRYGVFLNTIINFIIVALAIFVVIKLLSALQRKQAAAPAEPALTTDQKLLTEIRDLIKNESPQTH